MKDDYPDSRPGPRPCEALLNCATPNNRLTSLNQVTQRGVGHYAGHPSLKETPFADTGHPILLPGNPTAGSVIMAADVGAHVAAYSVNHGAGRAMGRKAAERALDQKTVDDEFTANDILTNCRLYPKDEAPAAYKDFDAVLDSVKTAGLASEVARLKARFVIKDSDTSLRGAA